MAEAKNAAGKPAAAAPPGGGKIQQAELAAVLAELDVNRDQLGKRQLLIRDIEAALSKHYDADNKLIVYLFRFGHPRSMITSADIVGLETVLNSVSGATQLNVLLHSPGGDGTVIEKMIDMCRGHIRENGKLRVIVPNLAKSAATLFALGADEILMGYCSELGPIDPQIQIVISGAIQWVSALAFVESRDNLMKAIEEAVKAKKPTVGLLQQLAGLNIPFTHEMQSQIDFAEKTATRLLETYMLKPKIKAPKARNAKAKEIAKKLLSKQLFPNHGSLINAAMAKKDLDLEVEELYREGELWRLIWKYYIRAEIQMNIPLPQPNVIRIKLFESADASMVTPDTAN